MLLHTQKSDPQLYNLVLEEYDRQEKNIEMAQVIANAKCLASCLEKRGFRIVSGGTDNHIVLVDLRSKKITGQVFQDALETVGITVNKNMIPFDPESPMVTSGVRVGTTSISQRGLREPEVDQIADIMNLVAQNPGDNAVIAKCKARAEKFISNFPLYKSKL